MEDGVSTSNQTFNILPKIPLATHIILVLLGNKVIYGVFGTQLKMLQNPNLGIWDVFREIVIRIRLETLYWRKFILILETPKVAIRAWSCKPR